MSPVGNSPLGPGPRREYADGPVYEAERVELPPPPGTSQAASVLYVLRWGGVLTASVAVVAVTVAGWWYFVQTVHDPPDSRFLNSAENVAARERVRQLQSQVAELRKEIDTLNTRSQPSPRTAGSFSTQPPVFRGAPYIEPADLRIEQLSQRLVDEDVPHDEMLRLAFDRNPQVRELIHSRLNEADLWEAAFFAMESDYHQAVAAAAWIAEQTPVDQRRDAVRQALARCLWLCDEKQQYPALAGYAGWAVQEDFDSLLPLLDEPMGTHIVADVCRGMARTSHPRLHEVLAQQSDRKDRVDKIGRALGLDQDLTHAVIAYLAVGELSMLNQSWTTRIGTHAKPEDLPALEAYADRIAADVRFTKSHGTIRWLVGRLKASQPRQ